MSVTARHFLPRPLMIVAGLAIGLSNGVRAQPADIPTHMSQPAPEDRSKIAADETLNVCLGGNPNTLNPILSSSSADERLKSVLFDYPFIYDENLEWRLNDVMVESYSESPDRLVSILKLKEGLRWHDGHPFTAEDIAFSWRQIMDDRVPAHARSGPEELEDCVALDPLTVKYVHQSAKPTNKWNIMFGPIPRHIYDKGKAEDPTLAKSDYNNKYNRNPVGNGPYKFVDWDTDDKIVVERWDDYPGPKAYFKRIVFHIIPDEHARHFAFERQEIDETELTTQQFIMENDGDAFSRVGVKARAPRWTFYYFGWNQDGSNPFFDDTRVRRAMSFATPYDRIINRVFDSLCTQSYGPFHEDRPMFDPSTERFYYDLKRAASLLDAAGWRQDERDGLRYKTIVQDGKRTRMKFSFTMTLPKLSTPAQVGAILQDSLRKIGVQMNIREIEWASFLELLRKHDFEAFYSGYTVGVDPGQADNLFATESYESGRNYTGYSDPRVDELFKLAESCFDESTRNRYYAEMAKKVYEDAVYTFILNKPTLWAFHNRLRGIRLSPRGPMMFDPGVRGWWVPAGKAIHAR